MAARLTFESKLEGIDKVIEYLNKAEQKINDVGSAGGKAFESMDKKSKEFEATMKHLSSSQSSIAGVIKQFDQINSRANDTLNKSYKGATQSYQDEVQKFRTYVEGIGSTIDKIQFKIDELRRNRDRYSEEDFHKREDSLQRRMSTAQGYQASGAVDIANAEMGLNTAKYDKFVNSTGYRMTMAGLGLPMAAGQLAASGGRFGFYNMYERANDGFVAQRDFAMQASKSAQQGDITLAYLRKNGLALSDTADQSSLFSMQNAGQYVTDSWWARGMAGAAAGFAGGGYAGAALGGTFGAGVGAIPGAAIGSALGGLGGFAFGALSAKNRSYDEIQANNKMQLDEKSKKLYGELLEPAGKKFLAQAEATDYQERALGIQRSFEINQATMRDGVTLDMASGYQRAASKYGNVHNLDTTSIKFLRGAGVNSEAVNEIMGRSQAAGNAYGMRRSLEDTLGLSGLTSASSIPARGMVADYISQSVGNQAEGRTNFLTAGAGVANIVSAIGGGTEGAAASLNIASTASAGGGLIQEAQYQGLYSLIGFDPAMARTFFKMGLSDIKTQEMIVRYARSKGKVVTLKQVQAVLGTAGANAASAITAATGFDEQSEGFLKREGISASTLMMTDNLKTAQASTDQFGTQVQRLMSGDTSKVPADIALGTTTGDIKAGEEAKADVKLFEDLKKAMEATSSDFKNISTEITSIIAAGYQSTATKLTETANKLAAAAGEKTADQESKKWMNRVPELQGPKPATKPSNATNKGDPQ